MAMISAIILAAGRSERMGRPKPLVEIGARPMLARTLESVRRSRVDQVVLVLGHEAERVQKAIPHGGVAVVVNPEWEAGMSTSLRAGVRAVMPSAAAFLVVLGDTPFVSPKTIDILLKRWRGGGPRILIPTYLRVRGNPVLLSRSLTPELEALTGDVGARALFEGHAGDILEVPVEDAGVLLDIDAPEQVEAIQKGFKAGRPLPAIVAELVAQGLAQTPPPSPEPPPPGGTL